LDAQFNSFVTNEQLTSAQAHQFAQFLTLLQEWNKKINITRIIDPQEVIAYHFQDSLRIGDFFDMNALTGIADVGAGGGFPGIPLAIKWPHLNIVLIEVNQKKVRFLQTVIKELGLKQIEVIDTDWRTFLRTTSYPTDLVCARASLQPAELVRMFKPGCAYQEATLVYWASAQWQPKQAELPFLCTEHEYQVGDKIRKYAIFKRSCA